MRYYISFVSYIILFLLYALSTLYVAKAQNYHGEMVVKKSPDSLEQFYFLLKKTDSLNKVYTVDSTVIVALNDFTYYIRDLSVYWFSTGGMYTTIPILNYFEIENDTLVSKGTFVLDESVDKCSCIFQESKAIITCGNKKHTINLETVDWK